MQVQGKIKIIGEVQTFGNDFTKRELVVITDDQYPQLISIDFLKDKKQELHHHYNILYEIFFYFEYN